MLRKYFWKIENFEISKTYFLKIEIFEMSKKNILEKSKILEFRKIIFFENAKILKLREFFFEKSKLLKFRKYFSKKNRKIEKHMFREKKFSKKKSNIAHSEIIFWIFWEWSERPKLICVEHRTGAKLCDTRTNTHTRNPCSMALYRVARKADPRAAKAARGSATNRYICHIQRGIGSWMIRFHGELTCFLKEHFLEHWVCEWVYYSSNMFPPRPHQYNTCMSRVLLTRFQYAYLCQAFCISPLWDVTQ